MILGTQKEGKYSELAFSFLHPKEVSKVDCSIDIASCSYVNTKS